MTELQAETLNGILKGWDAPELFRAGMNHGDFSAAVALMLIHMQGTITTEAWTKLCDEMKEK